MAVAASPGARMKPRLLGTSAGHRGPSLVMLVVAHAALFLTSFLLFNVATGDVWPLPGADPQEVFSYMDRNAHWIRLGGALQFASAIPLAIYASSVFSRLSYLRVKAAGPSIALAGGIGASLILALSRLGIVTAAEIAERTAPEVVSLLHQLVFSMGGPAMIVFAGLLIAGITVPSSVFRFLPQGICRAGVALALISEVATLSLALDPLWFLLPIARFGGVAWLAGAAILLPHHPKESR